MRVKQAVRDSITRAVCEGRWNAVPLDVLERCLDHAARWEREGQEPCSPRVLSEIRAEIARRS